MSEPADHPAIELERSIAGDFTLAAFIRAERFLDEGPGGFSDRSPATVVSLEGPGGAVAFLRVLRGRLQFAYSVDGRWYAANGAGRLPTGRWVLVAGTYRDGKLAAFVDGFMDGFNAPVPVASPGPFTSLVVGRLKSKRHWIGGLDEVRLFDRALSSSELRGLLPGSVPTEASTVALPGQPQRPFPWREAMRVGEGVVHPIADSGGAHVVAVPWSGPEGLELLSTGHPVLFGHRTALLRPVGEDESDWRAGRGLPLYDAGRRWRFRGRALNACGGPMACST